MFGFFFGYTQSIYNKDTLTILADALHNVGGYKWAISIKKQAVKAHNKASKDVQTYSNAKYFHTNSSSLEYKSYNDYNPDNVITKKAREQYLDRTLKSAIRARGLYRKVKRPVACSISNFKIGFIIKQHI